MNLAQKIVENYNVSDSVAIAYELYTCRVNLRKLSGGRRCFRDSTRTKCYAAERRARNRFLSEGLPIVKFQNIEQAEYFMKLVLETNLWKEISNQNNHIHLEYIKSKTINGDARRHHIRLSDGGLNLYTLLHEMSHSAGNAHHDVSFRRDLLLLVRKFMGIRYHDILKEEFLFGKLQVSYKEIKCMEFPEWYKKYQITEKARAARR